MKFAVISDTHGQHEKVIVPNVDCLIHCGDITSMGTWSEIKEFMKWFANIDVRTKIFVAGNHDFHVERDSEFRIMFKEHLERPDIIYLRDQSFELNGIKIHGSPMSPRFGNWAFMADRGEDIKKYWDKIEQGTDILITHSPPQFVLDCTVDNIHAGCEELGYRVENVEPKYHLFGHIHEGRGRRKIGYTEYINATCFDENYEFKYQPYEFEIETKDIF